MGSFPSFGRKDVSFRRGLPGRQEIQHIAWGCFLAPSQSSLRAGGSSPCKSSMIKAENWVPSLTPVATSQVRPLSLNNFLSTSCVAGML